ncbi:TauD/TfdA family dioxygenase [Parachlamydia acanthamoebae]|uniref:TauD/TfdA family dioxygenase n=1 Tax=Parachlamydia acanthamoebae TaxID=83552 RepID=UPI0007507942|nr:TauD/TfdA family dioxygenase [Parachlamydia acanthamoebae]
MQTNMTSSNFVHEEWKRIKIYHGSKSTCLKEWISGMKSSLIQEMTNSGGILLRGFPFDSMSAFDDALDLIYPKRLNYIYRSTPRKELGKKIYTTTEYPAHKTIPQHNENSYSNAWPAYIIFYCSIPSPVGGRTPLTDSRMILQELPSDIIEKFERLKVMYIRNYTYGIDLSWQEVFQTDDKKQVEKYCDENQIKYSWSSSGPELTTKQTCQSTFSHPTTKEKVWFNQAHLFHPSNLDENERSSLANILKPHEFPRNAVYGNGEEIEPEVLQLINKAYNKHLFSFQWQKGDVLFLDNVLTTHGREPFQGTRKIAAAMV